MNLFELTSTELLLNANYCFEHPKLSISTLYIRVFSFLEQDNFIVNYKVLNEELYNQIKFFVDLFQKIVVVKCKKDLYSIVKYYYIDNLNNPALSGRFLFIELLCSLCSNAIITLIYKVLPRIRNENNKILSIEYIEQLSDTKYMELSKFQMCKIINKINLYK